MFFAKPRDMEKEGKAMNKQVTRLGATIIASALLAACGGGSDEQDVYQRASRDYECYNVLGTYVETLNMSFSAESMQVRSGGELVLTAGHPSQTDGGYGYAEALPSSLIFGLVMYPNGKEIAGKTYGVVYAFSYPGTSTVNPYSSRLCK